VSHQQLNEELRERDLHNLVDDIFEVDSYASKMGSDRDIVVLSFTVEEQAPAKDLVNFVERGYDFVLDADATPGELENGRYKVFVEIERNRRIGEQVMEILDGVGKLTGIEKFKFRYHKSFHSLEAVTETLKEVIPNSALDYEQKINERKLESYEGFFSKSMLENLSYDGEILKVKKIYAEPLRFKFLNSGNKDSVMETISDRVNVEGWPEVIFLTKYFGDYNITKYGNKLIFDDGGYAVVLERIQ
jgi:hypothetical protein